MQFAGSPKRCLSSLDWVLVGVHTTHPTGTHGNQKKLPLIGFIPPDHTPGVKIDAAGLRRRALRSDRNVNGAQAAILGDRSLDC